MQSTARARERYDTVDTTKKPCFSADEQDDIVIQAGAVPFAPAIPKDALRVGDEAATLKVSPQKTAAPPSSSSYYEGVSAETAALLDEADEQSRAEFALHMKQKRDRESQRLITTEEDLHRKTPFHRMRMWILIISVVLIAAFATYWHISFGT